jgi:hypothetical protein
MAANVPEKGTVPSALLASKLTELGAMMAINGKIIFTVYGVLSFTSPS